MATSAKIAASRERQVGVGEKLFAVSAILFSSTAFIRLFLSADEYTAIGEESVTSPTKTIAWVLIYTIAIYFLYKRQKMAVVTLRALPILFFLIVYIALSVFWSENRMTSILSVAALTGNTLVGVYFGIRYSVRDFLRLLAWVYGIIAVASVLAPLIIGEQALTEGYLNGFFAGKNTLGANMTIGFVVFVMLAQRVTWNKNLYRIFAIFSALLVLLSQSATSIVILCVLILGMLFHSFETKYIKSSKYRIALLISAVSMITLVMLSYWEGILALLGKSPDLTGRVGLWGMLLLKAKDHPLLGYGYGGFWILGGPAQSVWDALHLDPQQASYSHNGYLQLLIDCGTIGLLILLVLLFSTIRKGWAYAKNTQDFWPAYLLGFIVLNNLTEATLAARNSISWLLFVTVAVQLVRAETLQSKRFRLARQAYHPGSETSSAPA